MGVENSLHSASLAESKASGKHQIPSKNSKKTLKEIREKEEAIASRVALLKLSVDVPECADLRVATGSVPAHSSLVLAAA